MRYMRQRVLAGILAAALLSGQAGITAVSAGTDSGTAESADFSGHETVSVAGFAELSEEEARQTVPVGTQKEDLPLPEELEAYIQDTADETVSITDITWESEPEYDGLAEGEYVFTPVLPEEYVLPEDVSLPAVSVTVTDDAADNGTAGVPEDGNDGNVPDQDTSGESGESTDQESEDDEAARHIAETEGDCMDLDCPIHYPEAVREEMEQDEVPELLTLEDLVEDYGVTLPEENTQTSSMLRSFSRNSTAVSLQSEETHPQTLMVTEDNENNAHTGSRDGDIDASMSEWRSSHPIEIAFTLDELPTQSAYLAVKAYDVDEDSGETDYVYINDDIYDPMDQENSHEHSYNDGTIGYLSGTNNTWNTTVLEIPLEKLQLGKNVISVTIATGWCVQIDWMQLILDGGESDENIESFSLDLADASVADRTVTVEADVEVRQNGNETYMTEYTLIQDATGNALDACFGSLAGNGAETIGLDMPLNSESGLYRITGILKDENEQIKATDEITFYFVSGAGLGPRITHTLSTEETTAGSVTITVSAEGSEEWGVTDVSVPVPVQVAEVNGIYTFVVRYKLDGTDTTCTYTVQVTNIDKTPPEIQYHTVTVTEETDVEELRELFAKELTVSDNVRLAEEPLSYTIPDDITGAPGTKYVRVTAVDSVGNTAQEDCAVTVTPLPLTLTMEEAQEGTGDSFALSAVLTYIGGEAITETGFVWGVTANPTLDLNNGTVQTSGPVTVKGGTLSGTATGIAGGIVYYARAYARTSDGDVVYSDPLQFGSGIPDYGTISISGVSGGSGQAVFTISRTGGSDGAQTVYYRTVNGSAVGGTHFTHASGSVTFADGDASAKTVTVTEQGVTAAYDGDAGTRYSNADRTYSLEIFRVEGGASIDGDGASMTRTMTRSGDYTVSRDIYTSERSLVQLAETANKTTDGQYIADGERGQGAREYNVNFLTNRNNVQNWHDDADLSDYYTDREREYISATAGNWYYRYQMWVYEDEDGYENAYIGTQPVEDRYYDKGGSANAVSGIAGQLWACTFLQGERDAAGQYSFPSSSSGGGENSYRPHRISGSVTSYNGSEYVSLATDQTAYIYFGANGSGQDRWYLDGLTSYAVVGDGTEPRLLGVAPMAGGTYLPGDTITVSLVFDEIVDSQNSTLNGLTITTNVGTLTYAGGADTNVLYFTGEVDTSVSLDGDDALQVTSVSNAGGIKDMCATAGTESAVSGSANVTVDASQPSVTITANTTGARPSHTATITAENADHIQYVWTTDTALPAYGWTEAENGETITAAQDSGTAGAVSTWYLHVLATTDTGASAHTYESFSFQQPAITEVSVRESGSASGADVSGVWRAYKYIVVEYTGTQSASDTTLTFGGPRNDSQTFQDTGGTRYLRVTENGVYTVTLTDSFGNVLTGTVNVQMIDTEAPSVTLQSGSGTDAVYNELTFSVSPSDTGGSGIASVEYAWTTSESEPSAWNTLTPRADGSYTAEYTATESTRTTRYLYVRVTDGAGNTFTTHSDGYDVIAPASGAALPSITVTGNPTGWTSGSAALEWSVTAGTGTGAGDISSIVTPDGMSISDGVTALPSSGSCTVTENGMYVFSVIDEYGNTDTEEIIVNYLDNEAPSLGNISASSQGQTATVTLTAPTDDNTSQYDSSGNYTGRSGSGIRTREYRLGNSGSWTAFTGNTFTVAVNGTYSVRLTDQAGNSRTYTVEVSGIDTTDPTVTLGSLTPDGEDGWFKTTPVSVAVTYADGANGSEGGEPSGIEDAKYAFVTGNTDVPAEEELQDLPASGGTVSLGTAAADSANGTWYLYYLVTDQAGNSTSGYSQAIKKDSSEPELEVSGPSAGQTAADGITFTVSAEGYGPSGGSILAGDSSDAEAMEELDSRQDSGALTDTYTVKDSGTYYFRYMTGAGNTGYDTVYVHEVTFDTGEGSSVSSKLVWTTLPEGSEDTSVQCKVQKPSDPELTGHTFEGWYTDEDCTEAYDFDTQIKENTTLYAKWEAEEYSVSYQIGGETYTPDISYQSYTYGVGLTLPQPAREGYTFDGWYLQSDYSDGEPQTAIGAEETGTCTFYGRWIDVTDPSLSVELTREGSAADDGTVWHNAQTEPEIRLNYSDNEGVTALYVKVDDGDFEEISGAGTGSGTPQDTEYEYADLQEGRHTYTFRAEDAAENWKEQSVTVNLDTTAPVIGEITYEYKAADFLDWIIGKESLVITIPVEEYGSGAETIDYTLQQDGGEEQKLSAELADTDGGREAVLTFEADWKGTVTDITCTDTAGNVSAVKSLSSTGGIIVEDNAPEISFEAVTEGADLSGWLPDKETVSVEVADTREETGDGISSGIAEVTWSLDGGDAVSVSDQGFDSSLEDSCDFTVEITGRGEHTLNVTAVDHAGNTNTQSIKVKISEKRETPDAGIDYREETLTGLEPGGSYTIKSSVAAGETVTASDDGTVDIKEQWMGQGLVIVRQGNGTDYRDSEEQYLPVDKRPDAPEGLEGTSVSYQSEDGTITNVTAAMEYRKYEETSWIQITEDMLTEGSLTGLAAGTYLVRFQATDSSFVSPTKSVVVPEYTLVEIGGSIAVSGGLKYGETLTADISGMTPGEATIRYEWKRSGSADVLGTEQTYLLTADDIGHTITLTVYGTEAYTGELSAETARVEKADGAEISGAGSTDETIRNRTDGTITGITTAMEYKLSTEDAYIAVTEQMLTEGALTGLAPGSYDVRCQETEVSKPGPVKTFVIREGRTLTVSFESNGGSAVENETGLSWHNRVTEPAEPVREGYRFDGWYEDSALQDAWDFSRDEVEDDLTLYAGWTDIASPSLSVELTREGGEADDGTVWHNAQTEPEIRLTYSDNEGVAALYVKVDEGEYSEIAEAGTGDGTTVDTEYEYTDLQEGKHTYTFRTEDAEGNRTEQSVAVNLDTAAPVIGEITCEYKEEVSGWIVGEERLVIRIPVEENGSGADAVTCTVREDGGEGQTVTVRLEDNGDGQAAELTFEADWKGTVTDITCTDTAGNVSDAKNLSSTGGIIVEDNAPEICFRAATEGADLTQWLPDQETVIVEVADAGTEASPAVSSGIAEVTWSLDGEEAVPVSQGRADGLTESCDFTVEISGRGEHLLSVTAVDHAGNTNTQQITVRISEQWEMPQAVIDYRAETLTGLAPEGSYTIESNALESGTVTASADGTADIPERWMGQELVIIRNGNGADRRDSGAQILTVDARPDAPEGLEGTAVSYQSEDGTISGVTSAMEYRRSGDETWIPVTEDMLAGDVLEGLAAGMYEVRYQATETAFASPCSEISVPEYVPVEISGILRISGKMISGETLAADLSGVLPADADVRYEWRRSGSDEILGTESSYRLTADDIGHTISLTVYGIEAYTGQLSAAADGTVEAARAADTGDGAGVTAWLLLLIVSGAAAAGSGALGYRNKKRR